MSIPTFNRDGADPSHRYNRGEDTKVMDGAEQMLYIGLVNIDSAILNYLQEKIKPVVAQDKKQIQIPVIYGNPERWKSAQQDGNLRDQNGMIMLPVMMIRRTTMKKNNINNPTNKYQKYIYKTGWNSRNIYDKFTALNGITPSEVYHTTVVPDYYDITYEAMVWTEYMEQMNKVIENISFESNEYWGETNNFKFRATIDQFDQITDLPIKEARLVRNKFNINVKAYILPEFALDRNSNRVATTKLVYSPKKVIFNTELITSQK